MGGQAKRMFFTGTHLCHSAVQTLAAAGVASRRAAEDIIFAGRVLVNGRTEVLPQCKVVPGKDKVFLQLWEVFAGLLSLEQALTLSVCNTDIPGWQAASIAKANFFLLCLEQTKRLYMFKFYW